ncbi:MAG: hypothetical protein IKP36_09015 [Bacteroidaceae bacterium]|nr:hypothetical protein [Bacteroidaceae bacterium]
MNHKTLTLIALLLALPATLLAQMNSGRGYVVVTDFIQKEAGKDVSDDIQRVIDTHPNRTIYFPDGIYIIGKPILTPANPQKSVALELSNFAIIQAAEDWDSEEAMIRLGGKDPANNISMPGSNYYLKGGIIDGRGIAKGISIDSGRETAIRQTSIKNTTIGIHIKHGANSGSSDSDISDTNITGNKKPDCIGVLVEGYDNTLTNMRIGGVHVGVLLRSAGNSLRNIHPLYYNSDEHYESSCGFIDEKENNWYNFCYSDQFAVGFLSHGGRSFYDHCFAYWYNNKQKRHTVFKSTRRFNSSVVSMNAGMYRHNAVEENVILDAAEEGGDGILWNLSIGDSSIVTDHSYKQYMR